MLREEHPWEASKVPGDDVEMGLMSSSTSSRVEDGRPHVVIIGAGVGGVATAARLAKRHGYRVTVLEKNEFSGGRCSLIHTPEGFRFDQGPSLYLMPESYKQTFDDLGVDIEDHLRLVKCDPNYHMVCTVTAADECRTVQLTYDGAVL